MGRLIYAIGDIHGCHDQLIALLAKIKYHAKGRPHLTVYLGDYVDRGPKSREVVNQVRGLVTSTEGGNRVSVAIKGNHEDMMVESIIKNGDFSFWSTNGGSQTIKSYENHKDDLIKDAKWLDSLPIFYETENHIFVHAGVSPRYSLKDQPEEVLLWIRHWNGDDPDLGKHVVYGHTPYKQPKALKNSTGLDTGAVFGGSLTCGVFEEDKKEGPIEIIQVP